MDIVDEAYDGYHRKPEDKPWVAQSEESGIEPDAKKKDDSAAAAYGRRMRTPEVGFVNDIKSVGYPEIAHFQQNQQAENYNVYHELQDLKVVHYRHWMPVMFFWFFLRRPRSYIGFPDSMEFGGIPTGSRRYFLYFVAEKSGCPGV